MKKKSILFASLILAVGLSACGNKETEEVAVIEPEVVEEAVSENEVVEEVVEEEGPKAFYEEYNFVYAPNVGNSVYSGQRTVYFADENAEKVDPSVYPGMDYSIGDVIYNFTSVNLEDAEKEGYVKLTVCYDLSSKITFHQNDEYSGKFYYAGTILQLEAFDKYTGKICNAVGQLSDNTDEVLSERVAKMGAEDEVDVIYTDYRETEGAWSDWEELEPDKLWEISYEVTHHFTATYVYPKDYDGLMIALRVVGPQNEDYESEEYDANKEYYLLDLPNGQTDDIANYLMFKVDELVAAYGNNA